MSKSEIQKVELNGNNKCPCGTNRKYKNCCRNKGIIWYESNGSFSRSVEVDSEVMEGIKQSAEIFRSVYGREVEEDGFVFWASYDDQKNYDKEMVRIMREAGMREELIYAYCKTGRILIEEINSNIPKGFLKEYSYYMKEYRNAIKENPKNGKVNVILFVKMANQFLFDIYTKINEHLNYSYKYFIKQHLEKTQDFFNYSIASKLDYAGLCAVKTLKNLESINKLKEHDLEENIHATARSVYESYLYMVMINEDLDFFETFIKNNKRVQIRQLALKSHYTHDIDLYDSFFRNSSKFVHLDALSAQSYFSTSHPFENIDSSLIASIVGLSFAVLTIEQIAMFEDCKPLFRDDIFYMVKNAKIDLIKCYELILAELPHNNEIYTAIFNRLKE